MGNFSAALAEATAHIEKDIIKSSLIAIVCNLLIIDCRINK